MVPSLQRALQLQISPSIALYRDQSLQATCSRQDGRDTLYRIHGTSGAWPIGTEASSGRTRVVNEDIIALYDKTKSGARVIVR